LLYFLAGYPDPDSDVRYFGFLIAVLGASLYGGFGPGIAAVAASTFISAFLLLPPLFSIQIASQERTIRLLLFAGEGVLLSLAGHFIKASEFHHSSRSRLRRYSPVLLFPAVATVLKLLVYQPLQHQLPFALYYAAAAASAWVGGFGPGLAATLISCAAARFFFLEPAYSLYISSISDTARLVMFMSEGFLLSALCSRHRALRRAAIEAKARSRRFAQRLWTSLENQRALRQTSRDDIWELDLSNNQITRGAPLLDPGAHGATIPFEQWLAEIHPEDRKRVAISLRKAIETGREEWVGHYRKLGANGGYRYYSDHAMIVRDAAWGAARVVGRSAALTVPSATSPDDARYRALFEHNPVAAILTDDALRVVTANGAASRLLACTRQELTGRDLQSIFDKTDRSWMIAALMDLTPECPSIALEAECVRVDGEIFRGRINASAVIVSKGDAVGRIVTIEEIIRH
jgi:PAS domain S-box-containing protein